MKIAITMLLLCVTGMYATEALAQHTISIKSSNISTKDILEEIEKQTEYLFIYNREEVNLSQRKSIDADKKTVLDVLSTLFNNTDIAFALEGNNIMLLKKDQAQKKLLTGVIYDERGDPVIGANVVEKGTTNGVVTDIDGKFTLAVSENAILEISYIGYTNQEIKVGNQTSVKITLKEDSQALEEVVVVGYGTTKKKDLTGSVTSLDKNTITRQGKVSVSQALSGQIPGLSVQQSSGRAATGATVILRGQSAIGKTVQPLVIIDGMPSSWAVFNNMNPNDIERLDVLKDASSTAIYGSRASGGVILVTTRSAQEGKNVVNYDGYVGVKTLSHMPEMMNAQEFYQMWKDGNAYAGRTNTLNEDEERYISEGIDTDWIDMVTRNGLQTSHNLSVSGGGKNETHFMSIGYNKSEGNQVSDNYERYSANVKVTSTLFDKFIAGASIYASYSKELGGSGDILRSAYCLKPWGNPKNEDGSDRLFPTQQESLFVNPVHEIKNSRDERKRFFANGNIFIEYKPIEGLSLKSTFMPAFYGDRYGSYRGENTRANSGVAGTSTATSENIWQLTYTWENMISYNKTFKDHIVGITGMFSVEKDVKENDKGEVRDLTYENEYWYNLAAATSITGLESGLKKTALQSYMLRANYGFKDKYLLTLTGRWDGSSKLAPGNQWGFFPSAALAWRAGEESFIKNLNIFSNLKFRLSYGISGNNAVDPYSSWAKLSTTVYDFDGKPAKGASASMANKALTWEKSYEYNIGADLGFFDQRLTATVDLYKKTSKDLIMSRKIPVHQGVKTLSDNVGSVLNKGIEVAMSSVNIQTDDFTWTTSLNFAINHNEILELYDAKKDDIANKWFIGQPVKVNYDYKFLGIWQLDEAEEALKYSEKPGMVKRWDKGGDGKFSPADDQVILGNPFPSWTGGITNNFTYKNVDFSFFIYTRQGEQVVSGFHSETNVKNFEVRYNAPKVSYWTPENPSNRWWAPTLSGANYTSYADASFWRVGNITLGYTLNKELVNRIGISNCRIYATANNPFVFTKYDGWDPEWATADALSLPIGGATYMGGINLSF